MLPSRSLVQQYQGLSPLLHVGNNLGSLQEPSTPSLQPKASFPAPVCGLLLQTSNNRLSCLCGNGRSPAWYQIEPPAVPKACPSVHPTFPDMNRSHKDLVTF